jgi:hypothetical protein
MTEKSENQGSNKSQNQNTAHPMSSSTKPTPILPRVDPAKTINFMQDGVDPKRVKK